MSVQVSANGNVLRSEIVGAVKMRVYLSGMPELRLGLNDKVLFESTGRKFGVNTCYHTQCRKYTNSSISSKNTTSYIYIYIYAYSGTPRLRLPFKSEWGSLKRGVVSCDGFATFNTRGRLQRLTSTLGGA